MAVVKVKLTDARDEYLGHMEARGLKPGTVRNAGITIDSLIKAVGNIYLSTVGAEHMDKLFGATNWSVGTRNLRRGTFNAFFAWARNRRYMRADFNPLLGWRRLRRPERDKLRVPVQEWGRLMAGCTTELQTMTVALGLYTFLRSSEMQALQIQHVDLENKVLHVYRRKTETRDEMPICTELDGYLRHYLTWYAQRLQEQGGIALSPEHYLLPTQVRGSLRTVNQRFIAGTADLNPDKPTSKPHHWVQQVLDTAGYGDQMSHEGVHTLRRSGARAYFDALVDRGYDGALRRVQSMLGHSSTTMTEIYLGIKLDREQRNRELAGHKMFPDLEAAQSTLHVVNS